MHASNWKIILYNPKKIVTEILKSRGIEDIDTFLNPPHPETFDEKMLGFSKQEIEKAVSRIKQAKEKEETVVIYGDYDVDGVCSTSLMWQALHAFGLMVYPFVPDRFEDGYGMTRSGIDKIVSAYSKVKLIVTVDNGIVAYDAIEYAAQKGIEVIVTDHHEKDKKLDVAAIVHSTKVCGTTVAWVLARELNGVEFAKKQLDLVGIATIADQMDLSGINRSFAFHGIHALRESTRAGVKALCATSAVDQGKIGSYEIGFVIGPRINAAGRLANALDVVRLMCTPKIAQATTIAGTLSDLNTKRQQITKDVLLKARTTSSFDQKIIVVVGDFHEGVIGLAAGKIVEETGRPAVVLSITETVIKGSARSIKGIHITKILREFEEMFINVGGHEMAAGLSMEPKNLEAFLAKFQEYGNKNIDESLFQKTLTVDAEVEFSQLNLDLAQELSQLEPFGVGNLKPLFATEKVEVVGAKPLGSSHDHLKLEVKEKQTKQNMLLFYIQKWEKAPQVGDSCDVVYSIGENVWNGKSSLELIIRDFSFTKKNERKTKTTKRVSRPT